MAASRWVHLDVEEVVKETDKALLLRIDGEEYWVPKAQLADPDDYHTGDRDMTISILRWFVANNDIPYDEE